MNVHLEMTRQVGENTRTAIFGTVLATFAVFLVLVDVVPDPLIYSWIALQAALLYGRFHYSNAFYRFDGETEEWERAVKRFTIAMFFIGLGWGLSSVLTAIYGSILEQIAMLAILLGITGAAMGTVAQIHAAYTTFLLATMTPQIIVFLLVPEKNSLLLGLMSIVFCIVAYRSSKVLTTNIKELVDVRMHLSSAKKVADEANAAKSQFLSRMSHEFRTPLNAIIGFSQVQEWQFDQSTSQEMRQSQEHILHAGKHLLTLVEDIFDIVKIEQDRIEIALQPIELDAAIQAALTLVKNQAESADVQLHYNATPEGVVANASRLTQVFVNLLSNAIKYNRPGGKATVTVCAGPLDSVEISVEDTGVGIDPGESDQLFTPFSRLTYATLHEIEGTGIGLTLSKFLIERMNGTIGLDPEKRDGATFWVRLPRANASEKTEFTEPQNSSAGN